MNNENRETIYFKETIEGNEHYYRIFMTDDHFDVIHDGRIIGQLQHDSEWKQISGDHLSPACIAKIGEKNEDHYE
ncbi:hypothetical protein [Mucilaginibacter sp. UYCu711]|uniref:hypothetical protein n=1 Tax=Mucilaginibacter sp. UYCu711 TaxID=3156339 RepID=UPI003D1C1000